MREKVQLRYAAEPDLTLKPQRHHFSFYRFEHTSSLSTKTVTHQVFNQNWSHIKTSTKTGEQTFVSRESVNKIVSFREDQMDQVVVRTSYDEFKIGVTRAHTPPAETTEKHTWPWATVTAGIGWSTSQEKLGMDCCNWKTPQLCISIGFDFFANADETLLFNQKFTLIDSKDVAKQRWW